MTDDTNTSPPPLYPSGDGDPNCPECGGRGVVPVPPERRSPFACGEAVMVCKCRVVRDIRINLERGWKGLTKAKPIPSPLLEKTKQNLWITCSSSSLRGYLQYVASRMGTNWNFLVKSDADLMDAWLSPGIEVYDADVDQMRHVEVSKYVMLVDLIEPPELLILHLGVKAARNKAMPEVLLETIKHRAHIDKVTWIADQPHWRLGDSHLSYNAQVGDFLSDWEHLELEGEEEAKGLTTFDLGSALPASVKHRPIPVEEAPQEEPETHGVERPSSDEAGWMGDTPLTKDARLRDAKRNKGRKK